MKCSRLATYPLLLCIAEPMAAQSGISPSATVTSLTIEHQTRTNQWADTHDAFALQIRKGAFDDNNFCTVNFPTPTPAERQKGTVDEYTLDLNSCGVTVGDLGLNRISVVTQGGDMWLPAWFRLTANVGNVRVRLIDGSWPGTLWFSTDPTDVAEPNVARPHWSMQHAFVRTSTVSLRYFDIVANQFGACLKSQLQGTLTAPAPGANSGIESFTKVFQAKSPSHRTGSNGQTEWYCEDRMSKTNLKGGKWQFTWQALLPPQPVSHTCTVDLPRSDPGATIEMDVCD